MDTTQDSLWNRKALFALRGGPVNEERCKKWITGRGELRARAAHARLGVQQQHHQQHAGRDSTSLSSASSLMSSLSPFSRLWCHSRPPTMILHFIGEGPSSKSVVSICLDFNRIIPGSPKWRKYDIFLNILIERPQSDVSCLEVKITKAKNGFWTTSQDVFLEEGTDLESDERWWWEWRCFHSNAMWQSASGLQATTTALLLYHHSSTTTTTTSTNTTIPTPSARRPLTPLAGQKGGNRGVAGRWFCDASN